MSDALMGVLVGGGVSLVSTLLIEHFRFGREQRRRLDRDRLDVTLDLVAALKDFEGAQYRRGRAICDRKAEDSILLEREEVARAAYQRMLLVAARARVFLTASRDKIEAAEAASKALRDLADGGLPEKCPKWRAAREAHRTIVDDLQDLGSGFAGQAPVNGKPESKRLTGQ